MSRLPSREHVDFLVLGGGVAGLSFALEAAGHGSVLVLTKRQRSEGSTQYAQGGIASVLGPDDDFEQHVHDTLVAGAGLCHRDAVDVTVREGPDRIRWLQSLGSSSTGRATACTSRGRAATRGAGSRTPRTPPAARWSGRCSPPATRAGSGWSRIWWRWTCSTSGRLGLGGPNRALGAYVLDRETGEILTLTAGVTVLATGGAGKVYLYTSNPDVATGDGVAMAFRAGAAVANMEFFQFHPTCLFHPEAKSFLISRGAARRGRPAAQPRGRGVHVRATTRGRSSPRATSSRAPSTRRSSAAATIAPSST